MSRKPRDAVGAGGSLRAEGREREEEDAVVEDEMLDGLDAMVRSAGSNSHGGRSLGSRALRR